jgi:hypothetical protein
MNRAVFVWFVSVHSTDTIINPLAFMLFHINLENEMRRSIHCIALPHLLTIDVKPHPLPGADSGGVFDDPQMAIADRLKECFFLR